MAGLRSPEGDIGVARIRIGSTLALVGVFVLLLVGFALLDRLGLDTVRVPSATVAAALGTFVLTALVFHGRRPADYYVADRDVPPIAGGVGCAAGLAGLFIIAMLGGAPITDEVVLAWAVGALVALLGLAILIGPGLRQFGGYTAGDFMAARFDLRTRLATSAIAFTAALLILLATLKIAGPLLASLFGLSPAGGLRLAAAILAITLIPGGFRSVAAAQVAQFVVMALAALVPAAFLAAGGAESTAFLAGAEENSILSQITEPLTSGDISLAPLPILLVAAGLATLATMVGPSLAAPSGRGARGTMLWTLGVGAVLLAAGILLAEGLADAVGAEGFGQLLADPIAGALAVASLPTVLSGLLTAGAVSALLATGGAALLAAAGTLSHDLWDETLDRVGPTGRRIFVARLAVVLVAAIAVFLLPGVDTEAPALLLWAMALAAAGNLAPLLLGLWWPRCNALGALLGTAAGFVVTGWGFLHDLNFFPWSEPGVEAGFGAPSAAAIGMAASFAVAVGVSLLTPAPSGDVEGLLKQIRSRRGRPIMRERPA